MAGVRTFKNKRSCSKSLHFHLVSSLFVPYFTGAWQSFHFWCISGLRTRQTEENDLSIKKKKKTWRWSREGDLRLVAPWKMSSATLSSFKNCQCTRMLLPWPAPGGSFTPWPEMASAAISVLRTEPQCLCGRRPAKKKKKINDTPTPEKKAAWNGQQKERKRGKDSGEGGGWRAKERERGGEEGSVNEAGRDKMFYYRNSGSRNNGHYSYPSLMEKFQFANENLSL